ncbi:MAG: hypothetical protein JEY99_16975 [Spirochaetales bacterium]|nr:hypothetical protein [Spirochaetales bacterium]
MAKWIKANEELYINLDQAISIYFPEDDPKAVVIDELEVDLSDVLRTEIMDYLGK